MINQAQLDSLHVSRLASEDNAAMEFEALRDAAIGRIQELCGTYAWTDFNLHDPGVTLLEACLWGMSDLLYRAETLRFDEVPLNLDALPILGPAARVGHTPDNDALRLAFDGAHVLATAVASGDAGIAPPLQEPGEVAPFHVPEQQWGRQWDALQEAAESWSRRLLQHEEMVAEDTEPRFAPDVITSLLRRVRTRRFLAAVRPYRSDIQESAGDRSAIQGLPQRLKHLLLRKSGLSVEGVETWPLLGLFENVSFDPEEFEHRDGQSKIWPPHPRQVLTSAPVTDRDYLAELLARVKDDQEIQRVWITRGAVEGMRWDGSPMEHDLPSRMGALSILIQPVGDQELELLDRCRLALVGDAPESGRRWHGACPLGTGVGPRALGDELYFGWIRIIPVEVQGEVLVSPGHSTAQIRDDVRQMLRDSLSEHGGRASIDSIVGAPDPWESSDQRSAQERQDRRIGGWPPGRDIDSRSLRERIRAMPGVEEVTFLRIHAEGADLHAGSIPPFAVPTLSKYELAVFPTLDGGSDE